MKAEEKRLEEDCAGEKAWKGWGCYVSERAWGTVREDYSADGSAWDYFPFEQARSKTYRWNEDGIAGICDRRQRICFAVSLWNEHDPILKERFYGLGGNQGNHGEDVKEYYFYLDNTPTHSYMKFLYKYPQNEYPYNLLKAENGKRDKSQPEFELLDTGIFDRDEYFDIYIEYAKADVEDICIRITAANRAEKSAPLHILPTIWFRNNWSWTDKWAKPQMREEDLGAENLAAINLQQSELGIYNLYAADSSNLLFTENETNYAGVYGGTNASPYVKDGIDDYVVRQKKDAVNPDRTGTKAAPHYVLNIAPNSSETIYLRLTKIGEPDSPLKGIVKAEPPPGTAVKELTRDSFVAECEKIFESRKAEADEFYADIIPPNLTGDAKRVMRQALAGMLWSKQYYRYVVKDWLEGDPNFAPPPKQRLSGRNHQWKHLHNTDVISMPDKWEYPWYAAWDLAFHCLALALVDSDFAKDQLILMLREWYMHPNGQVNCRQVFCS